jgi:hypothetical protein
MGVSTSSYATARIALRVSGDIKPHHHDKVETPLVGAKENKMAEVTGVWKNGLISSFIVGTFLHTSSR